MSEPLLFSPGRLTMDEREGGYSFEFTQGAPPTGLVCLICRLVAREPHQAGCCGKLFCKTCLKRWRQFKSTCPHCQQELTNGYFRDTRAAQEIGDLDIYCPNRGGGCSWSGELRAVKGHLGNCFHRTHQAALECENKCGIHLRVEEVEEHSLACPLAMVECNQCGEKVPRGQLHQHLYENCHQRQYKCPRCHVTGGFWHMTTRHLRECPDLSLPCPNEGCHEMIRIDQVEEHLQVCARPVMAVNRTE